MSSEVSRLPAVWRRTFLQWGLVLILSRPSFQQKDPVNDFCRRFGHQTAIIDERLFIDGGLVDWNPIAQNPANYTNTWLLYNDLSTTTDENFPPLYANLSKNGSIPDVSGGVLWADDVNKRFYLFGGEYYQTPPDAYTLYSYDALNDYWVSFGAPATSISSVSWGAGISNSELGLGFYYGGWISNSSEVDYDGSPIATTGLVKYDMDSNVWTNNTGPDDVPRAEGVMVYLPASDSGMLIYFGGVTTPYGNDTVEGFPMSNILIYDIASAQWYNQTAGGDVPENRRRFCAGAAWADDQSSYNIYLYGGAGLPPNTAGFDDVYILTLPSFQWIKWYPAANSGPGNPHNSLTCNVVNGSQMLIIGGTFPLTDSCDNTPTWGTHNLDLGKQNSDDAMWYQYRPNLTSYVVPPEVISVVGGSPTGGATVTAPASGWEDRDLPVYFTRTATVAARTPTRDVAPAGIDSGGTRLSTGAIVGIAVGGFVFLLLIGLGIFCCVRRRKRVREAQSSTGWARPVAAPPTTATFDPMYTSQTMHSPMHSPYSVSSTSPTAPDYATPYSVEQDDYSRLGRSPGTTTGVAELAGEPVTGMSQMQSQQIGVGPPIGHETTKWERWPPRRTPTTQYRFVEMQSDLDGDDNPSRPQLRSRANTASPGTGTGTGTMVGSYDPHLGHTHTRSLSSRSVPRTPAPRYDEVTQSRWDNGSFNDSTR